MLLQGKSLVVTGGNSGIGEAIVLAAAAEGANVVVDYVVDPASATELVARSVGVEGGCVSPVHALVDCETVAVLETLPAAS